MKVIKILGIEKKPKSKKYIIITEDLNYTVSEDMVIKHQLFKEKSFTEDEFKQVIEDILEDEYFNKVINLLSCCIFAIKNDGLLYPPFLNYSLFINSMPRVPGPQ